MLYEVITQGQPGSGGGKICYMAAQLTGTGGQVIGVDMNDDMLALRNNFV